MLELWQSNTLSILRHDAVKPLTITSEQHEQIEHDRFHHPFPQIQRRMEALLLAGHGMTQAEIAQLSGRSLASLQRQPAEFRSGGLEVVPKMERCGKTSKLHEHTQSLEDYFRKHSVATIAETRDIIEQKTGIRRGLT